MRFGAEKSTSKPTTFVEQCLNGDALADDIDDFVDRWHDGRDSRTLREAIGLSKDEYDLWVQGPSTLKTILFARSEGMSLKGAIKASSPDAIAALPNPSKKARKSVRGFGL
jgi:hypothetical protein